MSDIKVGAGPSGGQRGERGERGHRGHAGPTGPTGAASTVPGPTGPAGSGSAAPWLPITTFFDVPFGGTFDALAGFFNLVDASSSGDSSAVLPAAASVPNGTPLAIGNFPGIDTVNSVAISITLQPGDTLNGQTTSPTTQFLLDNTAAWLVLVSDGVSNWQPISYAT